MIQRGMLPLWNPYSYLGMPLAAQMQRAVWYPGTLPFYFFGFETGLPIFHVLHYWLAGALIVGNETLSRRIFRLYPDRAAAWRRKHEIVSAGVGSETFEPVWKDAIRNMAVTEYSWEAAAKGMEEVYRRLL